jgi:succinyl-diaminopimelate desuccinylase
VTDLLAFTAELVDIPSVSHDERAITDHLEQLLSGVPWLELERVGENLIARTQLGRSQRLVLAGHTDTVPVNQNDRARIDGDVLYGLGACDMKSGVAVLAELARTVAEPAVDVTYVFYACEEVGAHFNGVNQLFAARPDLLAGDAAVLAEPTGARIEAGCQGTMRVEVTLTGERAHTARAWLGRNAIHRLGEVLARVTAYEARIVNIDGCEFREGLQAVKVDGGVAGNVVPDKATVWLNHRFAPDRSPEEAEEHVRSVVGAVDGFEVVDMAAPAAPALDHPLLRTLVARTHHPPRAKLGWTDVSRFAEHGIPATNFGPGDPTIAHTQGEHVTRADLEAVHAALLALLRGAGAP